ncbi:hypothetical protein GCM10009678_93570 [Actinomadura kijaniata]|uniref:Uncharacterized protein n=1 Tax=Actinomadura namibiensis TaxID=182080 RepID=A0A7W3QS97_ACTNM|nr:hypothetical protein [Actinomadura namibiensis]MBA8957491.1 hypothetical protein [Actinomadura namibiensis]
MTNTVTAPAVDKAHPLNEMITEMGRLDRPEYKHLVVGQKLPQLMGELHVHAWDPADELASRLALETLIDAFQTVTFVSGDLGYEDLASIAAVVHPGDVLTVSELFRLCRDLVDIHAVCD